MNVHSIFIYQKVWDKLIAIRMHSWIFKVLKNFPSKSFCLFLGILKILLGARTFYNCLYKIGPSKRDFRLNNNHRDIWWIQVPPKIWGGRKNTFKCLYTLKNGPWKQWWTSFFDWMIISCRSKNGVFGLKIGYFCIFWPKITYFEPKWIYTK